MTVKELIAVLGTFPADMPVGSIHTCECCTSVEPVEPRHVRLGTIENSGAMSPAGEVPKSASSSTRKLTGGRR